MPIITIGYGVAMELLGIVGYLATGSRSLTALIPCVFGTLALACGLLAARRPDLRKHAMHAAAILGLIGTVAPLRVFPQMIALLGGGQVTRPSAVIAQAVMLVLSAVFLLACIFSFIQARARRVA